MRRRSTNQVLSGLFSTSSDNEIRSNPCFASLMESEEDNRCQDCRHPGGHPGSCRLPSGWRLCRNQEPRISEPWSATAYCPDGQHLLPRDQVVSADPALKLPDDLTAAPLPAHLLLLHLSSSSQVFKFQVLKFQVSNFKFQVISFQVFKSAPPLDNYPFAKEKMLVLIFTYMFAKLGPQNVKKVFN